MKKITGSLMGLVLLLGGTSAWSSSTTATPAWDTTDKVIAAIINPDVTPKTLFEAFDANPTHSTALLAQAKVTFDAAFSSTNAEIKANIPVQLDQHTRNLTIVDDNSVAQVVGCLNTLSLSSVNLLQAMIPSVNAAGGAVKARLTYLQDLENLDWGVFIALKLKEEYNKYITGQGGDIQILIDGINKKLDDLKVFYDLALRKAEERMNRLDTVKAAIGVFVDSEVEVDQAQDASAKAFPPKK